MLQKFAYYALILAFPNFLAYYAHFYASQI